jgi:hypothetical protein
LVISRPDLFDKQGVWRSLIEQRNASVLAKVPAFSIYEFASANNAADKEAIRKSTENQSRFQNLPD